ncbi:MAG: hypothetical protein J6M30_00025 [Bacteroidales bacterium]|nr:hypothetical protein [Bacteroidales bacterium]
MKKLIIGLLLGMAFLPCSAQTSSQTAFGKHELGISAGLLPTTDSRMFADILVEIITFGLVAPDDMTAYGSYALDYGYHYSDEITFGAFAGYSANKTDYKKTYQGVDYKEENLRRYYYFVPTAKLTWSHGNTVNFYSYAGVGVCYKSERTKATDNNNVPTETDNSVKLAFQITPIGMEIGKAFKFFVGFGHRQQRLGRRRFEI